ncbi:unnamed protein product [Gordionus sp. m RMFG-2023]|uniref:uncharacterized protein LOC135923420 isoform X2 n=1 Tax=Gordionus sp. m RMFG-2023 TaxID=3053472 RepID=UPI0030DE31BF
MFGAPQTKTNTGFSFGTLASTSASTFSFGLPATSTPFASALNIGTPQTSTNASSASSFFNFGQSTTANSFGQLFGSTNITTTTHPSLFSFTQSSNSILPSTSSNIFASTTNQSLFGFNPTATTISSIFSTQSTTTPLFSINTPNINTLFPSQLTTTTTFMPSSCITQSSIFNFATSTNHTTVPSSLNLLNQQPATFNFGFASSLQQPSNINVPSSTVNSSQTTACGIISGFGSTPTFSFDKSLPIFPPSNSGIAVTTLVTCATTESFNFGTSLFSKPAPTFFNKPSAVLSFTSPTTTISFPTFLPSGQSSLTNPIIYSHTLTTIPTTITGLMTAQKPTFSFTSIPNTSNLPIITTTNQYSFSLPIGISSVVNTINNNINTTIVTNTGGFSFGAPFAPTSSIGQVGISALKFDIPPTSKTVGTVHSFPVLTTTVSTTANKSIIATSISLPALTTHFSSFPTSTIGTTDFGFGLNKTTPNLTTICNSIASSILTTIASDINYKNAISMSQSTSLNFPKVSDLSSQFLPKFQTTGIISSNPATVSQSIIQAPEPLHKEMNYRDFQECINNWKFDVEGMEKTFVEQACKINAWETIVRDNAVKLNKLSAETRVAELDETKIEQQLAFLESQQSEIEKLLLSLETQENFGDLKDKTSGGDPNSRLPSERAAYNDRQETFNLALKIDGQLSNMEDQLRDVVEQINSLETETTLSSSNGDSVDGADSFNQITQILNTHMDLLKSIENNTNGLKAQLQDMTLSNY